MTDPTGALFAQWLGLNPNFHGDQVRNVYTTTGGTISPIDRMSLVQSASAIALTLPAGPRDGCPLTIKNLGAGALTLTSTIDGTAGTTNVASLGTLRLTWYAAANTWLAL
ncbi:MAG: hypothetical protein HIU92_02595 [Proteobacteria bacterium]|nr:hypothetical protein [Pseudomonadota bacterium]